MASWVTHLMIADRVLAKLPTLDRRGFCVGSIAPDCNVENEDFTAFTPPREVTHWMRGNRKSADDCEAFYEEMIAPRRGLSPEEHAFLLGYYAHLLTDAAMQRFTREENRVKAVWARIHADERFREQAAGMQETWDAAKALIPRRAIFREIAVIEAEYLASHPRSGFLTEILPLEEFPDYLDFLPTGAIVRKIGVMGKVPSVPEWDGPAGVSRAEYDAFVTDTAALVINQLKERQT